MSGARISDQHDRERFHCEFVRTLGGTHCGERGDAEFDGLVLCGRHARQLRLEEQARCWEAMLLHVELWSRRALWQGREDVVWLLEIERSRAVKELGRVQGELGRTESVGKPG